MQLIWLVLVLPLLGSAINGLLGSHLHKRLIGWLACGSVGIAFALSIGALLDLLSLPPEARSFTLTLFDWIVAGDLSAPLSLLLDPLSMLMVLVVSGVGFLIHVYSVGYMGEDPHYSRYFSWLNLFVFSMLLLVLASNFLVLFVGWELVGLCSYLLIGYWFTRPSAAGAAQKAFIVNRVGDFGFMVGLLVLFAAFGTFDYLEIFESAPHVLPYGGALATIITLLLFSGAVGKSAQIPLYVWLPDAMEGPTPVSALIHAATMVTAGVYLVARTHVLYELAPVTLGVVAVVGSVTALFAATIALVNNDIKRVLAYSTISQLGYMFLAAGVGGFAAGMYHLTGHAFMKALLFLAAGSVMHALHGRTDMRGMGGLKSELPWTWGVFLVGALAMSGIPPLVGFFSKDLILEEAFIRGNTALWGIGLVTAVLTAFYMLRAHFLTFHGSPRYREGEGEGIPPHESPPVMLWPIQALAALTLAGGLLWVSYAGFEPLQRFLAPVFAESGVPEPAQGGVALSSAALAVISLVAAVLGIAVAWLTYVRGYRPAEGMRRAFRPLYTLLADRYYVDELYDRAIVRPGQRLSDFLASDFDRGFLDGIVNGVGAAVDTAGATLRRVESGYIRSYVAWLLLGALAMIAIWWAS